MKIKLTWKVQEVQGLQTGSSSQLIVNEEQLGRRQVSESGDRQERKNESFCALIVPVCSVIHFLLCLI